MPPRTTVEGVVALRPRTADGFDVRRAYAEHGRSLYGFALNSTRDRGLAEECVQETFARAWRARERYSADRGSQRTWLFAIARNVVVDAVRARTRRPIPVPQEGLETGAEPRTETSAVLDRIVVHSALATLSADHREVVVAVQLDGLSYQQLSERTGVPTATLRTRMFYAMRALRAELTEEDQR